MASRWALASEPSFGVGARPDGFGFGLWIQGLYEPQSKLLKGGYIGDYIGDYYRGY